VQTLYKQNKAFKPEIIILFVLWRRKKTSLVSFFIFMKRNKNIQIFKKESQYLRYSLLTLKINLSW